MGESLWGKWIKVYLLKKKSFWEVKDSIQVGSWMWRKLLRLREVARQFFKMKVGNGRYISFWYDQWSDKGILFDQLGDRGMIAMGIRKEATIEKAVMRVRRRRKHREELLNDVEA